MCVARGIVDLKFDGGFTACGTRAQHQDCVKPPNVEDANSEMMIIEPELIVGCFAIVTIY
jgi:hypothetical protein